MDDNRNEIPKTPRQSLARTKRLNQICNHLLTEHFMSALANVERALLKLIQSIFYVWLYLSCSHKTFDKTIIVIQHHCGFGMVMGWRGVLICWTLYGVSCCQSESLSASDVPPSMWSEATNPTQQVHSHRMSLLLTRASGNKRVYWDHYNRIHHSSSMLNKERIAEFKFQIKCLAVIKKVKHRVCVKFSYRVEMLWWISHGEYLPSAPICSSFYLKNMSTYQHYQHSLIQNSRHVPMNWVLMVEIISYF